MPCAESLCPVRVDNAELAVDALDDYTEPAIDDAVRDELDDYVARRSAEGGALPES